MNSSRKYEYVMDLPEIREFCLFALREQFKFRKSRWIVLLCIILAEAFVVPEAAAVVAVLLIVMLLVTGIYYYRSTVKVLDGQPWTVFPVEGGRLKVARGNCVEFPCRDIRYIHKTKHLLLLGYLQSPKRPAWFVMPLRIFESEQEREAFLALIRNAQAQPDFANPEGQKQDGTDDTVFSQQEADRKEPQEYMRFSYFLDREKWVRLQKGAADLLNSGTLGRSARTYSMVIWGLVMVAALTVCTCLVAGEIRWTLICYSFGIAFWFILWMYGRDPQKRIRKQLDAPEVAARVCGQWQVSLTQEGVTVYMPAGMKSRVDWDSLTWLIETQEAFYLFYKDKKHYVAIAKESFASWDQVDAFHRICRERGVHKIEQKKARYVPEWLSWVILGLLILVILGLLMARIFLDFAGRISGAGIPSAGGYAGTMTGDYPVRVPLEEHAKVLSSLGLSVPEETVAAVRSTMVEYDLYDLAEESPYTWLLTELGVPVWDEEWNLVGYSSEVFWFDFEGFDISTDYIGVLNGMLALAEGSPLDSIDGITEDTDGVDWELGRGTVTVCLNWEGKTYRYDMEVYNDWIDVEVLSVFNSLLEEEDWPKRFYATGDNGQGAIVFFCTPEWAEKFTEKTGLVLE